MRDPILLVFVVSLLSFQILADQPDNLENPWEQLSKVVQGEYLNPLSSLKNQEKSYLASSFRDGYLQAVATLLSYVGRYDEAQKYFDTMSSSGNQLPVPQDLSQFQALDAIAAILGGAKNKQIVMLNEAHHVPETRAITFALLKPLYDLGFKYFAMETFDANGVAKSEAKKFPVRGIGFYSAEPLMADVAREAIRIGYHLIAYEYTEPCDYVHDPTGCQDKREQGQARNLVDRILKKDPSAKVLIHAGYGHIDKIGTTSTFPWVPMAKYFKDFSGIDPFSIDQVEFRSRGNLKSETSDYRRLLGYFKIESPTILITEKRELWSALPGHYDAQVILPDSPNNNSYPNWAKNLFHRREVSAHWRRCAAFPCLIQAVLINEQDAEYIPFDQIYAESKSQANTNLILRPGNYMINYVSRGNTYKGKMAVQFAR